MRILSFDPGAATGWGLWDVPARAALRAGVLIACGLCDWTKPAAYAMPATFPPGHSEHIELVFSERPKHYPQSKVPVKDLITLSLRAGECAGPYRNAGAAVTYYEPFAWKGTLTKDAHHGRIWGHLLAKERALIAEAGKGVAPSKRNNIMDGVGIGLFALGRTTSTGSRAVFS